MRAAVVFEKGQPPRYVENFPEPVIKDDEILMTVKAVALKHLDKMRASGKHYSTQNAAWEAKVVGGDGVGILEDGTRVYAIGTSGTIAEKTTIEPNRIVKLPNHIDDSTAAALPNAVMGSALAMRFRAQIKGGETVLINGATGFTGKVAVQIAKYYGAGRIIATGRNEQSLKSLIPLGADQIISLKENDEFLVNNIKHIHANTPIDIVLDYVWGHSAELILDALKGDGGFSHLTRYVTIGAMAGDKVELSSSILRSTNLQIMGSGLGSWTKEETRRLITDILPEMFRLAADNKLIIQTTTMALKNIESVWEMNVTDGNRLVVVI